MANLNYSEDEGYVLKNGRKVYVSFTQNDLKQFAVIVEMWKHIGDGKGKREYVKNFTETERAKISKYYKIIYNWYLVKGFPQEALMKISTYDLLCRASNFLAGL
jgi:hypothetical protein